VNIAKPSYAPLPPEMERVAKLIGDSAFSVHKSLGPGLFEGIYEPCFCHAITKRGAAIERQVLEIHLHGRRFLTRWRRWRTSPARLIISDRLLSLGDFVLWKKP